MGPTLNRRQTARFLTTTILATAGLAVPDPGLAGTSESQAAKPEQARSGYLWRDVKVGGGGFIPGIVFSRQEAGLAYLRSDMGGLYRWDASTGSWHALQDGMAESSYFGVESVALDPNDVDVVHATVGMYRRDPAAMMMSADRGRTWRITPVDFPMGGNEDGRGLGERLAIDPADSRILYFGSRFDGLQKSEDQGLTWRQVPGFPLKGKGVQPQGPTHAGLSFVVFGPDRTIFVGSADTGDEGLFRSDDAGLTWQRVPGGPAAPMAPVQAQIDDRGRLYVTWCVGVGPNGVTDGAVMRLDVATNGWTDITPPRPSGGFMGLSLDRQHPGTLVVATMNRWQPGDTIWRTVDDGRNWRSLRELSARDVSATPFLKWGQDEAPFGWWIAGVAIDPFDTDHIAYATGATIYASRDLTQADRNRKTNWKPWVDGIEQTAVISLCSLPVGPSLLSGFGDISGFAHEDLTVSSPHQFVNPVFTNTNGIDYAGLKPNIVVRNGTPHHGVQAAGADGSTLALSEDCGMTWVSLGRPGGRGTGPGADRPDPTRDAPITVSADGSTLVVATPQPIWSADKGKTWQPVLGLPRLSRPVADRVDPLLFYALDYATSRWFVSVDGARSFATVPSRGLPNDLVADQPRWREAASPLRTTPGYDGDVWFASRLGMFNSRNGGQTFDRSAGDLRVEMFDFGLGPSREGAGRSYPSILAIGWRDGQRGVYRSDDRAATWVRVNDADHEWGRRFRAIAGDLRRHGRVYVATDGRGILYGEPEAS